MAVPEKYMPTGAETSAELNGPCRMRVPKRDFLANSSSTCSGLKSPNMPAAAARCASVTVTAVPKRSPTFTSSYHFPGNMTYYAVFLGGGKHAQAGPGCPFDFCFVRRAGGLSGAPRQAHRSLGRGRRHRQYLPSVRAGVPEAHGADGGGGERRRRLRHARR